MSNQLTNTLRRLRGALLPDAASVSDGDLLQRFVRERDEAAFAALVRRHGPMVLGVCRRVLRREHDAEDAFQATFLVLARKAASVRPPGAVGNWLYGVAHRTALEARRSAARRRAKEAKIVPRTQTSEDVWAELRPVLDEELARLPDSYRTPIVLCDLEDRTRKEAARQLGLPEGTVASRLARGRVLLARRLSRHGLALSGGAVAAALAQDAAAAGVPVPLVVCTVKVAVGFAAGHIPARVAALTEGVLKAMFLTQLKVATLLLLAVSVLCVSGGVVTYHAIAAGQAVVPRQEDSAKKVGEVRRFEGHADGVHGVALSPDGRLALSGAAQPGEDDPLVRLWT